MLFEDDIFKMEIPLEESVQVKTADKPAETGDKLKTSMQAQRIIEYIKENGFIPPLTSFKILRLKSSRAKQVNQKSNAPVSPRASQSDKHSKKMWKGEFFIRHSQVATNQFKNDRKLEVIDIRVQ